MRVLVTGGCGFIGGHLVQALLAREDVELVVNLDAMTYAAKRTVGERVDRRYHFEFVDLRNRSEVSDIIRHYNGFSHVIHAAAETHVDNSIVDPGAFVKTNVVGTHNLLESIRHYSPAARVLHVSTDEVFGSAPAAGEFNEESRYAPNSPYSASKAGADHLVAAWHATYGMHTMTTWCANNYGPGQHEEKLVPKTIARVLKREPIPVYGTGLNVRDWVYVGDHVDALIRVVMDGEPGARYCIGAGCQLTNLEMVGRICDLMGGGRDLITMVQDRPGHDLRYAIDASKIRRDLNWEPRTDIVDGLKEIIEHERRAK